MTDKRQTEAASAPVGADAARLNIKGIVESAEEAADSMPWREDPAAGYRPPAHRARSEHWNALSRQMVQISRLAAVLFFFSVVIGWPLGRMLRYWDDTGGLDGWSALGPVPIEAFLLATLIPILLLIIGYIMSRQMTMMGAAESIAVAAQQFIHPERNAAENARSVGAVVRGEMQALSVGLDGALTRLASVEAMIRQHVEAIETAGASIEARATGAVSRVADERARLIDLTEQLNTQADAFATAIAEKAQASIEALSTADDVSDRAQTHLEERLTRLDAAAQTALNSFNALSDALHSANETVRATTGAIEASTVETKAATDRATKASEAAAEAAARNAANVGASAARASEEAKKAAEAAIETARREAERASRAAFEAAEREARRVSESASKILGDVQRSTTEFVKTAAADVAKTDAAAEAITSAARRSAEASEKAAASVSKAGMEAQKNADAALAKSEDSARRIDLRNKSLEEARAALEQENARLESLIEEQRKRADRLADAIASQTERLSKLAETQIREQEANARLAEAQLALKVREEAARKAAAAKAAPEPTSPAPATETPQETKPAGTAPAAPKLVAETESPPAPKPAREEQPKRSAPEKSAPPPVLDLGAASRTEPRQKPAQSPGNGTRQKLDEMADDIAQRRKSREAPLPLTAADQRPADGPRRDKQKVSWREILDATDDAEPLDLAAASVTKPEPGKDGAANAIRIISELQSFTCNLETRLYGEPPPALRERFERGDRNVFANRLLRLNETDVKRRIRMESSRDKGFERDIHDFLQGFERLLEDATTSKTADEDLEEYLSSPLGRVYLLIGATVGYFA